jgi:hypothetical protein
MTPTVITKRGSAMRSERKGRVKKKSNAMELVTAATIDGPRP